MQRTGIVIGSEQHKALFCRAFIDTHDPYDPYAIDWPTVEPDALARLRAMPFWGEAIWQRAQRGGAGAAPGDVEPDPLMREAIAMQGYEEGRHSALLHEMLRHYEIPMPTSHAGRSRATREWGFMRMGYGECFDSFFAFGLYTPGADSGFFPPAC